MNTSDVKHAYEIRKALLEQADSLPASTEKRLEHARRIALSRKKKDAGMAALVEQPVFVSSHGARHAARSGWLVRIGAMAPIMAGAILFTGLYQFEQDKRISDVAEIDAAVLADELPISAYTDHGFNAFVAHGGE